MAIRFDNESISKIALHCAYEMFENDADINLINEANRVLRKGGKMIIIPLYMDHIYHIQYASQDITQWKHLKRESLITEIS